MSKESKSQDCKPKAKNDPSFRDESDLMFIGRKSVLPTAGRRIPAMLHVSKALERENLARLGILAFYFVLIDTIQSYYLGKVLINQYVELNAIPTKFYSFGLLGIIAYFPLEFAVTYSLFIFLWLVGSFMVWYYRNIIRRGGDS